MLANDKPQSAYGTSCVVNKFGRELKIMGARGSLINPYRFYGDKRALNRKLTGTGRLYRSDIVAESPYLVERSRSFANPMTDSGPATQCERISCRAPRHRRLTRLADGLSVIVAKLIRRFY